MGINGKTELILKGKNKYIPQIKRYQAVWCIHELKMDGTLMMLYSTIAGDTLPMVGRSSNIPWAEKDAKSTYTKELDEMYPNGWYFGNGKWKYM